MSNTSNSFVKLSRKMLQWQWKTDPNTLSLFVHCLLSASWCDTQYKGVDVKRGEFVTTVAKLSRETGLTTRETRTALEKLKATNELANKTTNKYTLITIVNWAKYQGDKPLSGKQNGKQSGNRTTNEYTIYNKKLKNIKKEAEPSPAVAASAEKAGMTVEQYLKRVEELKNQ